MSTRGYVLVCLVCIALVVAATQIIHRWSTAPRESINISDEAEKTLLLREGANRLIGAIREQYRTDVVVQGNCDVACQRLERSDLGRGLGPLCIVAEIGILERRLVLQVVGYDADRQVNRLHLSIRAPDGSVLHALVLSEDEQSVAVLDPMLTPTLGMHVQVIPIDDWKSRFKATNSSEFRVKKRFDEALILPDVPEIAAAISAKGGPVSNYVLIHRHTAEPGK